MSNIVPEGWNEFELKEIASPDDRYSFVGGPFGSSLKSEEYTDQGVRIIQLQNIGDGEFKDSYKIFTSPEKADELRSCNIYPGDIILSKMGDPVARAALIPAFANRYLMASDGIRLAVNREKFDAKFIHDAINSANFRTQAELSSTGSTRKRIGLTTLRQLTLAAPPLPEQQKIAAILSSVDDVIEKTRAQIDKLKDLKTGMMQELLTKGIGSGGVPHTEFKDSPVGRIPVSWDVVDLKSVCSSKYGIVDGPFGSNLKTEHYRESGIPVFQSGLVTSNQFVKREYVYVDQEKFDEQKRSSAKAGDILMAKIGMRAGACAIIPKNHPEGILAGNSLKMSVDSEKAIAEYILGILHLMQSTGEIRRLLTETAQPAVSITTLKKMKIALPPLNEQKLISEMLGSIDTKLLRKKEKLEQSLLLKKALMQDLLTGKVRVNVDQKESVVA